MSHDYIPAFIALAGLSVPFFGAFCHDCYRVRRCRCNQQAMPPLTAADRRDLAE